MRIEAADLREMQLFKYYRLVRKWACKSNGLTDADLELLVYFDCIGRFTRNDYINGTYLMSWDKARWEKLRKNGWIDVWRHRNRTTIKYSIFQTSFKSEQNVFYKNKSYTDKVFNKAIDDMIKDKNR